MVTYQAARQLQARRRALTAVSAVVLGAATPATRRFSTGAATTRATATTTMASALFAPRSNPIWVQKEGAGLASGAAVAGEALGWSILSAKSWFKLTAFFSKREQARRRALTAVSAVVLGTTTPTTRRLPTGTTTTRTTATTTMASALFAPRSSPFIFAYAQNHIG